ncbi:MAG TPA: efflux RND transporter permease subunit [Schlesneria sp.]|jgi:Cu(I)/Ag(I) efflux system membrane protein CusA/SilA
MIEQLIEASIRNRFLVLLATGMLTIAGIYAMFQTPVDAVPDLSENQVIVFTDWMGRSPREVEDQVTYPLARKLQGLAGVKAVRSSSEFNFSMITIIFEDGVDFYFARQRVTEKLGQAANYLPTNVVPYLAPDATALGQIFWYTVEAGPNHPVDPQRLWAVNKFYIAPQLNAAPGVSDVATVGGLPMEYQIDVRPESLRAYGITLGELYSAVARSNMPAGGGVIQKNNAEYIVRGIGWIRDKHDIERTVIREVNGTPIYVETIASVQLGTQFRRSVYEKNGSEVVGGVVLMRHGQNPLHVTEGVKEKIQELQPGLPEGVHIVPAYDRTRLIHGAIHTLTEVMWHEMLIASIAIMLILSHLRSVFVICITLPLAVLFSFLMMWLLRNLGIIDIQANIMSLAGITISIGILVDQAIVMVENATHVLKEKFGDEKVSGDITELVIPACRTVGKPIFFSVLIMLLSFVPVFMLSGREGKLFHPLAFTKSFALIGVAFISVTIVPALIPLLIRGRLRSEEDNWIVRSFIHIYKPMLTWALPRRNLVMWMFAVLLILAAGMFPLQAIIGQGASEGAWRKTFLIVFAFVTFLTVLFTRGAISQVFSFTSLTAIGLWAWHFPKIGVAFMPALDEGTTLDMPVTVPRASVTQAADDLKARDALLRGFPEVESVIGKAGRADTPTDPAPLDMVETFVNFRPREFWPKRVLRFEDALRQTRDALTALEQNGYISAAKLEDRESLVNEAAQKALERCDEILRELSLVQYRTFELRLGGELTDFAVRESIQQMANSGDWIWPKDSKSETLMLEMVTTLTSELGPWLGTTPALEDVTLLVRRVIQRGEELGAVSNSVQAMELRPGLTGRAADAVVEAFGGTRETLPGKMLRLVTRQHAELWRVHVREVNWKLFDQGVEAYSSFALEELARSARQQELTTSAPKGAETDNFVAASIQSQLGQTPDPDAMQPFMVLKEQLQKPFANRVFFWPRRNGPKGDLVDDEMGRVLQVPGWSNIFTQPIINRIEMLSTGVRTDIGVKVFGPDLDTIDGVCKQIEAALKPLSGARDTIASPIMGKGYLDINIDREAAARYGISVEDIQNEIEVALAGRAVTYTVEKRERFPVRIRYARSSRDSEDAIRRLLISPNGMSAPAAMASPADSMSRSPSGDVGTVAANPSSSEGHVASPGHSISGRPLIPLSAVADVKIVEGPAMIKSENGRLLNYVTLNVRGRDIVGFVEEARRVVSEKVSLPEGVHIEWSGEFEHQVRAARTLRFVFPAVIALIFLILYLTYRDLADAALMMLTVPEALAGGAFFMFLFPKIMQGWDAPPMDFSVAVWVGFIACFGMATETGIIMLVYLREAIERRGGLEKIESLEELRQAVIEGAVHRLRPKLLTEGVAIISIFPMVFATGVGGEILAPMALPVLGGLLISDEVVDLFLPVRFYWVRRGRWLKLHGHADTGHVTQLATAKTELNVEPNS